MSFAFVPKRIHCGRCDYEGFERFLGAGVCGTWGALLVVTVAVAYPPALVLALPLAAWAWLTPCYPVCPQCGWQHVISVGLHRENLKMADKCPCRVNGSCRTGDSQEQGKAEGASHPAPLQGPAYPVAVHAVQHAVAARAEPPEEEAGPRSP